MHLPLPVSAAALTVVLLALRLHATSGPVLCGVGWKRKQGEKVPGLDWVVGFPAISSWFEASQTGLEFG